ncbi:MAG TPA: hypothetical protein VGR70_12220 [Stellaceae bacterium]|nr:hypothetical protein [Stellaceae bacterium]
MKSLFAALAGTALLALAAPVSAQPFPMGQPAPMDTMPPQMPVYPTAAPSWAVDDGSSSDFPIPMPGDVSGDQLNAQYRNGIDVPPPNGFPAPYYR